MVALEEVRKKVRFFKNRTQLRTWFEQNHASAKELWIGYYKKGSGRVATTYSDAVEEALCFGWIDGQVRSLNEISYANRYAPRRAQSVWSRVNIAKARKLLRSGRMSGAGAKAFTDRTTRPRAWYSYGGTERHSTNRLGENSVETNLHGSSFARKPHLISGPPPFGS